MALQLHCIGCSVPTSLLLGVHDLNFIVKVALKLISPLESMRVTFSNQHEEFQIQGQRLFQSTAILAAIGDNQ